MKIKISNARLSFPDLFEAVQYQGKGPFNYRAQFLVPSADTLVFVPDESGKFTKQMKLSAVIEAVAKEKWAAKAPAVLNSIRANPQKFCLADGNTKEYEGYAGNWALSSTRDVSKGAPLIIDTNKTPLTAKSGRPYAGCYVHASLEIWAQDNDFGKAIRCGLLGVQFARDGDSFAGGSVANEDDFDDLGSGSTEDFEQESLV